MAGFELDPREADAFVRCMAPRQFTQRTDALIEQFRKELPAVLREANKLGEELTTAVRR